MRRLSIICIALSSFCAAVSATPIQVDYTATLSTVGGTAFGLSSADQGRTMSGFFLYDTATPDTNPDPTIGDYQLSLSGAGFTGLLGGATPISFTGTSIPTIQIVNTASGGGDSFRFIDGPGASFPNRFMSVNGASTANATLNFYIASSFQSVISSDALPTVFPWGANDSINFPHTFDLSNGANGDLLFQLVTLSTQGVPEPASFVLAGLGVVAVAMGVASLGPINSGRGRLSHGQRSSI